MACPCAVQHGHHSESPPSLCCAGAGWRVEDCPRECNCAVCKGKPACEDEHPTYGPCCEVKGHLKGHAGVNGGVWPMEADQ